ncbi:MAG: hypothetical protein EB060_11745 [Proteobacteria bacterium]|nr:hypothetical protein [Pseudomonadota bacterium]
MHADGIRILALSDVAVGYGSPQVQYLLHSIGQHYGNASLVLVEPDQKRRIPRTPIFPSIEVVRISTTFPPYDERFMIEFALEARRIIQAYRPHIVIATHGWVLPALLTTAWPPAVFIYYMLESLSHQRSGIGTIAIDLNRYALGMADIVLVPERRRAEADLRTQGWQAVDMVEVYNAAPMVTVGTFVEPGLREQRVLYAGSIGPDTLCEWMGLEEVEDVQFDIAGPAETDLARDVCAKLVQKTNIRYLGVLSQAELCAIRGNYAWSLVMWNPADINQLYASPNKFFETIQAGVPPIAGPHPQCADVIARLGCGRIMMDWKEDAFIVYV